MIDRRHDDSASERLLQRHSERLQRARTLPSIVVMGGSFNPPTIAHLRLMQAAIQAVEAEKGIFVPVGEAYLKRKMRKSEDHIRLNEQLRLAMLQAMCAGSDNLMVSDVEIQNPLLFTWDTMCLLQSQYPSARLYFLAGADKLPMLGSLASKTAFFEQFGIVLFSRDGMQAEAMILQDERCAPFASAFVYAKQPNGIDGMSSTAVRKLIVAREVEKAQAYLHPDVWTMLRHVTPEDFPVEIERFRGEYEFLSNSFASSVFYDGLLFSCAEAAFQAARCALVSDKKRMAQGDAGRAKRLAESIVPIPDWEERKLSVMEEVLRAKFSQHPELARRLTDTGDAMLIHGTNGKDSYWGRDLYTDRGENHLGQLLMKLRSEQQREKEAEHG